MLLQMGDGREGQMTTTITTQMVPQGLLVPRSALGEWLERGVDVVKEKEQIVIRPRPVMLDEREEAIRILEEAGLLCHRFQMLNWRNWPASSAWGSRCLKPSWRNARRGGEVLSGYKRPAQEICT
jgi:hypothetical protein